MKKIIIMAAGAVVLLGSCNNGGAPKANLKTEVDSVSYEVGLANSRGMKDVRRAELGILSRKLALLRSYLLRRAAAFRQ